MYHSEKLNIAVVLRFIKNLSRINVFKYMVLKAGLRYLMFNPYKNIGVEFKKYICIYYNTIQAGSSFKIQNLFF